MAARILIADDHPVLRAGLRALIGSEPNLQVVGEATDSDETMQMTESLRPDIVILDLSMPGCGGIVATERLAALRPETRVLVLTASEEDAMMRAALRAGASGFVAKRVAETELVRAIRAITHGDVYVHSAMAHDTSCDVEVSTRQVPEYNSVEPLTPREVEVLRLIALGYTNPEMAEKLQISVRTVETHRENLIAKLDMHSRVELVRYALDQGLLEANLSA